MKKLLITGAGGFLGSHLVHLANDEFNVYGLSATSIINLQTNKSFYFDLAEEKELIKVLDEVRPEFIIHCAAISSESGCLRDPQYAVKINVAVPVIIKNWSIKNKCRMIFTSSDLVFSGNNAPYDEEREVHPRLFYGKLKLDAELELNNHLNISIVRLPLLYGFGLGERKGFLADFRDNCLDDKPQFLFTDEFRTPAFVEDVASFMLKLLLINHSGILNLGGKERVSRFELGQQFCTYLGLPMNQLQAISRADINMEDRPYDTTMVSNKAFDLGYYPKIINENLTNLFS